MYFNCWSLICVGFRTDFTQIWKGFSELPNTYFHVISVLCFLCHWTLFISCYFDDLLVPYLLTQLEADICNSFVILVKVVIVLSLRYQVVAELIFNRTLNQAASLIFNYLKKKKNKWKLSAWWDCLEFWSWILGGKKQRCESSCDLQAASVRKSLISSEYVVSVLLYTSITV